MGARLFSAATACGICLGAAQPAATGEVADDVGIESAWLYGNMNRYAYYFADLLIGSPVAQRASVIVDTGSHLVGFPCKDTCRHCGDHLDPAFDFAQSQSARWLRCGAQCTKGCVEGRCAYSETYSEGSTISGFWFDDTVELGDAFSRNPPVHARLGCHKKENKLFYTQRANGIMGLAPSYQGFGSNGSRPTFLQDLFRDKQHVDSAIFSICLATWGGRLTVGGYDSSYHIHNGMEVKRHCSHRNPCLNDGTQWTRMHAAQYYFVFPEGMTLGGKPIAASATAFGVTIIDSGTTYTYFPGQVFRALVSELRAFCEAHDGCGANPESTELTMNGGSKCWRLRRRGAEPELFPMLRLQFGGGVEIDWPPHGYLHQRGEPGVWCQTFMMNNLDQTVLGISWMLHKDIIFDLSRGQLGVAQAACPEHRARRATSFRGGPLAGEEESLAGSAGLAAPPPVGWAAPWRFLCLAAALMVAASVVMAACWTGRHSVRRRPGPMAGTESIEAPPVEENALCGR